jgi:hypothetical protein
LGSKASQGRITLVILYIPHRKYPQFRDDRMDLGEGLAHQASKYLGARTIRSLGELPSSMGKISLYLCP